MHGHKLRKTMSGVAAVAVGLVTGPWAHASAEPAATTIPNHNLNASATAIPSELPSLHGIPNPELQPQGLKSFLIKHTLSTVSALLRSGRVDEVLEAAMEKGHFDADMARAVRSKPHQIADAIDTVLRFNLNTEEAIRKQLNRLLKPIVGQNLALGIADSLMWVIY